MLRETEIGQVAAVARADQDVSGLHIPVNQPALVCGVERLSDRPASKPADAGHEDEQLIPGARAVLARGVAARCAPPMPPDPIG